MIKHWITLAFCLFTVHVCISQKHNIKAIKAYTDSITKLKTTIKEDLISIEDYLSEYDDTEVFVKELGIAYHNLGRLYYSNKNSEKAIFFTKKAVDLKRKAKDTFEAHRSLNNLFFFHNKTSDKLLFLKEIIDDKTYDVYTLRAYNKAANIYIDIGDYHKALKYFNYVIQSYSEKHTDVERLVMAHIGSIAVYLEMKIDATQFYKVDHHHNEIKKHIKAVDPENFDRELNLAINDNNLAIIYANIRNYKEAIYYYKKALDYFLEIEDTVLCGYVYNNLGESYSELKEDHTAQTYFNKAVEVTDDAYVLTSVSFNKGFYLKTDIPKEKIPYYQKSMAYLLGDSYQYKTLEELPLITTVKDPEYAIEVLEDLIQIANAWVSDFKINDSTSSLENAKRTIYLIDELISYIRFESSIDKTKLFWINKGVDTYMLGVEVSYLLNDVESALYFMEKNKSLLMLENLNNIAAQKLNITPLGSIKDSYVSNTSNFIEYILNENQGYGVFFDAKETSFFKIENIDQLLRQTTILKQQLSVPFSSIEDGVRYAKNASSVFKKLFPFKNALQRITNKKLTIVSDYKITNIPFEALTVNDDHEDIKNHYLIHNAEISYLHSVSVATQLQKKVYHPKHDVLAIAPETFKIDSLTTLKQSIKSVNEIASLFSTTVLKNEEATKETVLSDVNDYKIIHFNTHAGVNSSTQEPWIALYDQKIDLQELYNQPMQADLVVLDACKSGTGKLEIGEGVMSLSRGFTYNGAKSVIASQWNANEEALSHIFKTFYKELDRGASKSQALHQAKLRYLNTHELSEISPYYWASMTLTGDANVIKVNKRYTKWYVLFGVILLIILMIRFFKK